jgi:Zn-dependent M28 family amino/carboxypeptidase
MNKFLFIFIGSATIASAQDDLNQYQQSVVASLSGADEIAPDIRINDRHSDANKARTRTYIRSLVQELGVESLSHKYRSSGENIYGIIPSTTGSNETVVIGAHFDSVRGSPGANDNATGVALAMGVAHTMASAECRKQNVMIVLFDEEEKGLVGSRYFAKLLKEQNVQVSTVHTLDQIGWDADGDRAIELELPSNGLYSLYKRVAAENGFDIPIHRTSTGSTDHSSFRREGFEAVGITEEYVNGDTTPHYHRSSDTFGTVNFNYLEDTTLLMNKVFYDLVVKDCE